MRIGTQPCSLRNRRRRTEGINVGRAARLQCSRPVIWPLCFLNAPHTLSHKSNDGISRYNSASSFRSILCAACVTLCYYDYFHYAAVNIIHLLQALSLHRSEKIESSLWARETMSLRGVRELHPGTHTQTHTRTNYGSKLILARRRINSKLRYASALKIEGQKNAIMMLECLRSRFAHTKAKGRTRKLFG